MVWKKVVFKQIQPIHIGVGSYGVINDTNIFIPGWTMWGALTKAYTLANGRTLSKNQSIFEGISCFYPSSDERGEKILFPHFNAKGAFMLGGYSEVEFRAKFVDTFTSTAVVPISRSAKEESLHEVNIILPGEKKEFRGDQDKSFNKGLFWAGVVNVDIKDFIVVEGKQIFVGGEQRYGLGLMEIVYCEDLGKKLPKVWIANNTNGESFLTNYLSFSTVSSISRKQKDSINITGKVKRIACIQKSWENAALKVSEPEGENGKLEQIFYVPGSKIEGNSVNYINDLTLKKGKLVYQL